VSSQPQGELARARVLVLIPLPNGAALALSREVYEDALAEGARLCAAPGASGVTTGDEPLVDAEQLAELLKIPASWIEQKARECVIPSLEFGRWRRFRRSEVEAAVRSVREG
jgi:excisionase family DNA binding protein